MNKLQLAMQAAVDTGDDDEIERTAIELGEEAVRIALGEAPPLAPVPEAPDIQRQRDLDAAFADAIEVVARQRVRLKRRVTSRHDGETTRRIYELLRSMLESGADGDPSFQ